MTDSEYGRKAMKYHNKIQKYKNQQGGYNTNVFNDVKLLRVIINETDKYDIDIGPGTKARDSVEALFRSAELLKLSSGLEKILVDHRTSVRVDGKCVSVKCKPKMNQEVTQGTDISIRLALDTIPRVNPETNKWEARHI